MDILEVGGRIREVRLLRRMTQEQLAERADLSVPYISRVECGKKRVGTSALVRITQALDVTLDQILSGLQLPDGTAYCPEQTELLEGCTDWERRVICDVVDTLKRNLRRNT